MHQRMHTIVLDDYVNVVEGKSIPDSGYRSGYGE
jgi:hypothetical protein